MNKGLESLSLPLISIAAKDSLPVAGISDIIKLTYLLPADRDVLAPEGQTCISDCKDLLHSIEHCLLPALPSQRP